MPPSRCRECRNGNSKKSSSKSLGMPCPTVAHFEGTARIRCCFAVPRLCIGVRVGAGRSKNRLNVSSAIASAVDRRSTRSVKSKERGKARLLVNWQMFPSGGPRRGCRRRRKTSGAPCPAAGRAQGGATGPFRLSPRSGLPIPVTADTRATHRLQLADRRLCRSDHLGRVRGGGRGLRHRTRPCVRACVTEAELRV